MDGGGIGGGDGGRIVLGRFFFSSKHVQHNVSYLLSAVSFMLLHLLYLIKNRSVVVFFFFGIFARS